MLRVALAVILAVLGCLALCESSEAQCGPRGCSLRQGRPVVRTVQRIRGFRLLPRNRR
jgi:hypothetical protein